MKIKVINQNKNRRSKMNCNTINSNCCLKQYSQEKTLLKFLQKIGFDEYEIVKIDNKAAINNHRLAFIVKMKNKNNGRLNRIYIDLKCGQPTVQQVLDAIYKAGSGCDNKIIVYDNCHNPVDNKDRYANDLLIENLVIFLNHYQSNIYLARSTYEIDENKIIPIVEILKKQGEKSVYDKSKLPSKEQFLETLFWVYHYDSLVAMDYGPTYLEDHSYWLEYEETWFMNPFNYSQFWNGEGLYLKIFTDKNPELLRRLFSENQKKILHYIRDKQSDLYFFKNLPVCDCQLNLNIEDGIPRDITVRVIDISIQELNNYNPDEKNKYARLINYLKSGFNEFIEEIVENSGFDKESVDSSNLNKEIGEDKNEKYI